MFNIGLQVFEILFQDENCLVIEKPSGMSVLRDRDGSPNVFDTIREEFREAKLVHRLDKGTSGVMVVALTKEFQAFASRQFARRHIRKFYIAVISGHVAKGRTLTVELPLNPGRKGRYRVAGLREEIRTQRDGWSIDSSDGHPSTTRIRTLELGRNRTAVTLQPLSGRTHQLRVHMAWIGHSIVGDGLYGVPESSEQSWRRLLLHSTRVCIDSKYSFTSRPPKEFQEALRL